MQPHSVEDPVWPVADGTVRKLVGGRTRMPFVSVDVRVVRLGLLLLVDVPTLWCSYMTEGRLYGMATVLLLAPQFRSSS